MIFTNFLLIPYYFLAFIIGLIPASQGFPPEVLAAAEAVGSKIGIFGPVMDVATLSAVLGILFSAQIGIWAWKSFKWIVSHIPWIGGRG